MPWKSRLAYFAQARLFKIDLEGGGPIPLAEAPSPAGGTWAEDGTIVFVPTWNEGLFVITAEGGAPKPLLRPDPVREYAYTAPHFLPGGRELLYSVWTGSLESGGIFRASFPDLRPMMVIKTQWTRSVYAVSGGERQNRRVLVRV